MPKVTTWEPRDRARHYLTTTALPASHYLKISTWTGDATDSDTFENKDLAAVKAMFPKTQPRVLILPAVNADGASGSYWTAEGKYIRFDATSISTADVGTGTKCSVRCIQKFDRVQPKTKI